MKIKTRKLIAMECYFPISHDVECLDLNEKWVSVNDLKNEICNMVISYEEGDINDVDEFAIKLLEKLRRKRND